MVIIFDIELVAIYITKYNYIKIFSILGILIPQILKLLKLTPDIN